MAADSAATLRGLTTFQFPSGRAETSSRRRFLLQSEPRCLRCAALFETQTARPPQLWHHPHRFPPPATTHGCSTAQSRHRGASERHLGERCPAAGTRARARAMLSLGIIMSPNGLNFSFYTAKAQKQKRSDLVANAEKKKRGGISFGDQLLDYIEGGPKLRKWYGARDQIPKGDAKREPEPEEPVEEEGDVVRDAVLVTDADSDTGQLVVLELILRRLRVRALVRDIKAATAGFGAYVEPVEGDVSDKEILRRVMRGVRAIICPTKVGELADRNLVRGVEHLVLLSKLAVNSNQGGLGSFFGRRGRRDAEENEAAVSSLGIPYTIVRTGSLKDERGGRRGFSYGQGGVVQGTISREDAAYVCVEALDWPPQSALVFEVVNGDEDIEDWSAVFSSLKETGMATREAGS